MHGSGSVTDNVLTVDGPVDAAMRFLEHRYHRYPVLDENRLVGQISRRDVMRALGDAWQ